MKIKKYKVCMRLGPIYEKCQTPKFTQRQEKPQKFGKRRGGGRGMSDYGGQLIEKQKVRMTYGLKERQFARLAKESASHKGVNSAEMLFRKLETRLDNVVYRTGLAQTRLHARQIVCHGHITVNGRKMSVPSYVVKVDDVVSVAPRSTDKGLFNPASSDDLVAAPPAWLTYKADKKEAQMRGLPVLDQALSQFDLGRVVEFYSR